jgi:predicted site-specific integrase-resolvase
MSELTTQRTCRTTYKEKLRPTPTQERQLETVLWRRHTLYNIVLEHRITAWQRCHVSVSRFGGAYIQTLLKSQGRDVVISNEAEEGQDALLQDFVAIITGVCARLYGRRRASRKKTHLLAALEVS